MIPSDIILLILDNLECEDKVEFVCCCQEWYCRFMRNFIRKLHWKDSFRFETYLFLWKLRDTISDPFRQLVCHLSGHVRMNQLLPAISYSLFELKCALGDLFELTNSVEAFRVKKLHVSVGSVFSDETEFEGLRMQRLFNSFRKITDCETLSVQASFYTPSLNMPYLPSVKSLSLFGLNSTFKNNEEHFLVSYSQSLYHLSLTNCNITDISMLGSVPYLELRYCPNIVDISFLNDNDHILVEDCNGIQDYSCSFANSRRIEVIWPNRSNEYMFDMRRWKKVEVLSLHNSCGWNIQNRCLTHRLPLTVKRLCLEGSFVVCIDFAVTPEHKLQDITLSNNLLLRSLAGYGLERVSVVKCRRLLSLESLDGLGTGKNQKIIIDRCDLVEDFSVLNHLHTVEIHNCVGFRKLSQLQHVYNLTISSTSFRIDPIRDYYYNNIHSLTLQDCHPLQEMDGLEQIPHLQLPFSGLEMITRFYKNKKILQNQSIVVWLAGHSVTGSNVLELHHRFLKDQYHYTDRLPMKWVWLRKETNL